MKKYTVVSFLLLFAVLSSGCIYLRLLEVKNQIAQFDQHFIIDKDDGLTLTFLKPVLSEDDVKWMGFYPTIEVEIDGQKKWVLVFEKVRQENQSEKGDYDLFVESHFRENKLNSVHVSERYFAIIPKEFSILLIKAIGGATINRKNKTVSASMESSGQAIAFPNQSDIVEVLGIPYRLEHKEEKTTVVEYHYRSKWGSAAGERHDKPDEKYIVKYSFADKGILTHIGGKLPLLGSMDLKIDQKVSKASEDE